MESYGNKQFATKSELFAFLRENKETLITQKREQLKTGAGVPFGEDVECVNKSLFIEKSEDEDVINIKAVINTTNVIDSHGDLHVNGIWNKSVKENKRILLLKEHQNEFDNIIAYSSDIKASVLSTTFKELGFNLDGTTEALVYEAKIRKDVNPEMYERYKSGFVTEHSVGMRYVKLDLAINDENEEKEYATWNEYSGQVANKEALENGYFWVVKEAKQIEGSAVPMGSNPFTPTIKEEPTKVTPKQEPSSDTPAEIINKFRKTLKH